MKQDILSADAIYAHVAGRAVYEQLVAENAAAMRELEEANTQLRAFGDQIARLQQANREANDRAARFETGVNEMRELVDHVFGELCKQKHQAPGANAEALKVLVKAYGYDITKRKADDNGTGKAATKS